MRTIRIILGILVGLLGIVATIFAWLIYFEEDTGIIRLASLYVVLFISTLITFIGVIAITFKK